MYFRMLQIIHFPTVNMADNLECFCHLLPIYEDCSVCSPPKVHGLKSNQPTYRCKSCKNDAKKGSDYCTPCQKNQNGICATKECNNQVKKHHKYCGLHGSSTKNNTKTKTKQTQIKTLKCRVCNKPLQSKSAGQRIAKGTAGAGVGTILGGIIGTIVAPGFGTLIGAGLGGFSGMEEGARQVQNICNSCCSTCESKQKDCICHVIIGLCRSCSRNVTPSNSRNGYCHSCRDSWNGDDL